MRKLLFHARVRRLSTKTRHRVIPVMALPRERLVAGLARLGVGWSQVDTVPPARAHRAPIGAAEGAERLAPRFAAQGVLDAFCAAPRLVLVEEPLSRDR